ncbi:MAG TPA: alpha/beta hydrolase [Mycobacteriales bacterium]|nr:alpha/beta hydrolase [Mycobacteriales bacterium]
MAHVTAHHGWFKDTRLHVDDTGGSGRPVVLIHAWPLSGQAWLPQISALHEAGYRVITYDRRGFGRSDKPLSGYSYDSLAHDLHVLVEHLDLQDVTLVGCSMGGGEVARYLSTYGADRVHSVVFASAVTPYMLHTGANPDGPLSKKYAAQSAASLIKNVDAFYEQQMIQFFSANGELVATDGQRAQALTLCKQSGQEASLACMVAWGSTDFRDDLARVSVPTLVIHGDADESVPFEGSATRTHAAIPHSELRTISNGPHGCNITHAQEFNETLLDFLAA